MLHGKTKQTVVCVRCQTAHPSYSTAGSSIGIVLSYCLVKVCFFVCQVCKKFCVGSKKVDRVRKEWREGSNLLEATAAGPGAVRGETDGRLKSTAA